MRSRLSSVSLPHCSFTCPLNCIQSPLIMSQFMVIPSVGQLVGDIANRCKYLQFQESLAGVMIMFGIREVVGALARLGVREPKFGQKKPGNNSPRPLTCECP